MVSTILSKVAPTYITLKTTGYTTMTDWTISNLASQSCLDLYITKNHVMLTRYYTYANWYMESIECLKIL